jgi:hypothetical protein
VRPDDVLVSPPLRVGGPKVHQALQLQESGKLTLQASSAAHSCTPNNVRLFITDKFSKHQFLIDTGSDLCVFPRKLVPQRRSTVNYDLSAANGTTIPTYGWLPLSLNLGLRRDFTWRFIIADVTQPIIGADFLSHYGLVVNLRKKRLLDGALSTPAQPTRCSTPSVFYVYFCWCVKADQI